jgi:hypothetical protein
MPRYAWAGLLGVAVIAAAAVVAVSTRQAAPAADPASNLTSDLTLPDRRAPASPAPVPPPPVPSGADRIAPLAYTMVTTWRHADGTTRGTVQRVTRTANRVHLALDNGRQEWVFVRNPRHPERVSGSLIEHDTRRILLYDETELLTSLRLRGWADVLMMRFDPSTLDRLRDTGEERQVAGLTFRRYLADTPPERGIVEAWWNPEQLLALASVARESATLTISTEVDDLTAAVESSLLSDPADRFPAYERLDAVDASDHRDIGH